MRLDVNEPLAADAFIDVRHFARYMLRGNQLRLNPLRDELWTPPVSHDVGGKQIMTCILFRNGVWQVEMLMFSPTVREVELHRHNHCESADVVLAGGFSGTINGRAIGVPRSNHLAANLEYLPLGCWHGATSEKGLVALSFQRWIGMEPTFIANDWEPYRGD
jgi:hypothetical protein